MALENGTIDITELVEHVREDFVRLAETYIKSQSLAIFAIPFLGTILSVGLHEVLEVLSKWDVMQSFFLNTTIRKASQAADYVGAVKAKKALSPDTPKDVYEKAERAQTIAFTDFVMLSN